MRHDRLIRRGGGSALCVRFGIKGNQIKFDNSILDEYAVSFLAKTAYGDIAIFSPLHNSFNKSPEHQPIHIHF